MTVIYYSPRISRSAERLRSVIESLLPEGAMESFQYIENFSKRLRKPLISQSVIVLLVDEGKDLTEILRIKDLFRDIPVILVLPTKADNTISDAYKLYPRFLSYVDSDFQDVSAVLEKMLKQMGEKNELLYESA